MGRNLLLTLQLPLTLSDTILAAFFFRTDSPAPCSLSFSALLLDKVQPFVEGLTVIIITN